jgi:hypothetical protein
MVTEVADATAAVVAWNVALGWPWTTITLAGTAAALVLLLLSKTSAPPAGAAALRVTLPVDAAPAVTVLGLRFILEIPVALDVAVLPEKLPAVCGGAPPQPIRNRNVRRTTNKKIEWGTLG